MMEASEAKLRAPSLGSPRTERFARLLLRSPLHRLVAWVAGTRASVHAKLLAAFLLVALLLIGMGAMSIQAITTVSRQSRLLDQDHERVDWSRQIEQSLVMQMNLTAMALLRKDLGTVEQILRENNKFNNTLARIEEAAPPDERELIQRIRAAQDQAMTTAADIADLLRADKHSQAMTLQLTKEYPLYLQIAGLVDQLVKTEQDRMDALRLSVAAANRKVLVLTGVFVGASILLALLLGFVISWSFILPVREAHQFLRQMAAGNFGTTITVPNRDEFGALADHMNQMSRELQHLYEDQRQVAQELKTLNEKLELASKAKTDFLASMSHELRTPMNAILGFTELLLDEIYGEIPAPLRRPLTNVQINGRHLLRLINDVLDLSKIEAGRMELSLGEYSVPNVVETVRTSLSSLAAEKGLEFVADTPADMPLAFGDEKRITQCLMNLAGNALKFTKQGRVEVLVELKEGTLVYRVSDTGIGIPKDRLAELFEEFRQADATIAKEFGGSGLGLHITKKFIEMHGGRIWVESELGKGSFFWFSIPLRVASGGSL